MIRHLTLVALALAGLTSTALAHFRLNMPTPDRSPDPGGKAPPCGDNAPATNVVNNYMPGQMIEINVTETVNHGGHYRVALAQSEAMLPAPPPVTSAPGDQCDSAPVAQNPTLPVLADGLFTNLLVNQTDKAMIQLPAGMTCTNCVLQVIQFMTEHGAPCFYYHCAKVNISPNAPDAGPSTGGDAGTGGPDAGGGTSEPSGGCSTSGSGSLSVLAMLGVLLLVARRRR